MKIILAGGGSGGHITPLLAVADSLRSSQQDLKIIHIGQRGEQLDSVMRHHSIDESVGITAGKFRRYNGESFVSHLLDIKTIVLNARDLLRFVRGTVQAWRLLGRVKPDAILLKGGYVCVPVGFAARLRRIPYMTHDSDAIPGLANRITAGAAQYNAVAMPVGGYPYETTKVVQTGIPIRPEFQPVTASVRNTSKKELGYKSTDKLLFVVGGGLGARNVNIAVSEIAQKALEAHTSLHVVQITGKTLYDETKALYASMPIALQSRVHLIDFTTDLYKYSAAADVVIARAGATNLAEFAIQKKPTILIPNPVLTGGQQLHNAEIVRAANAAIIVDEGDVDALEQSVHHMFSLSDVDRQMYGSSLSGVMPIHAAAQIISDMLIAIGSGTAYERTS